VITDPEELTLQTPESFYERFRVIMKVRHEVTAIHPERKTVSVKNLESNAEWEESYDKLVLSPGAKPVVPKLQGVGLEKVFTLRTVEDTLRIKEFVEKNFSDYVEIAYSADDLLRIKAAGKRAVLLSLENGYMLGKDIKNVEMFYNLGIRLITLCHFGDNDVCDSANGSKDEWGGLSPFGVEVVKEMNRLGMIIDLSHCSRTTVYDCIKLSKAPIVASHSGVYNYKAIPRNLTDPEMLKIAAKNGYIGLPAGRYFLSHKPKKELSVANIIDHVDYVKNLLGKEYIGIGTDFDGGAGVPGFENMSKMKEITKEMLRRGYTDEEIECFWGKNFIRVFKAVEAKKENK
jgi:microsomal dipeptidase-like Zn-dependent dipeptidase